MTEQYLLGVTFETCDQCTGVWLDQGELETVTRCRGGDALAVSIVDRKPTDYFCPVCNPATLLWEGEHTLPGDFLLDVCSSCNGIWFDRGEFPSLLRTSG